MRAKDVEISSMGDGNVVMDAIQAQQISVLAERLNVALKILTGDGNPKDGLVMDFARLQSTVEIMRIERERDAVEMRRQIVELNAVIHKQYADRELAEKERRQDLKQFVFPILQSIISSAIGAGIALFLAGRIFP